MPKLIVKYHDGKLADPLDPLTFPCWTVGLKWKKGGNFYGVWGYSPMLLIPLAILYSYLLYVVGGYHLIIHYASFDWR